MKSIKSEFIIITISILTVSLTLLMSFSYFKYAHHITELAKIELKLSAKHNAEEISDFYDDKARIAIAISEQPIVIKAALEKAKKQRGAKPSPTPVKNSNQKTHTQIQDYLKSLYRKWSDQLENLFIGDIYGYVMADGLDGRSIDIFMNTENRGGNYWKKTLDGNLSFGKIEFSPVRGHNNLVSVISAPIRVADGIIGTVGMPYDLMPLISKFRDKIIQQHGYAILIDENGKFIIHPNKDYILNRSILQSDNKQVVEIAKKMLNRQSGFGRFEANNESFLVYFTPITSKGKYSSQGLSIASIVNEDILLNSAYQMKNTLIIFMLFILLTSISILIYFTKKMINPLQQLQKAAINIGKGNLEDEITLSSHNEIGILARTINQMRNNLKESTVSIDKLTESEKRFQKANKLLDSVIKQSPFAVHVTDGDLKHMNVIIQNEESKRLLGEKVEGNNLDATDGKNLACRFYSLDGKREIPLLEMPSPRAFNGETIKNEEFLFVHPDKTSIAVEVSASPIYDTDNKLLAVVATFQDISKRIASEKEMAEHLHREQIANQFKTVFLANMSHEIRTPLHVVIGLTEELKDVAHSFAPEFNMALINNLLKAENNLINIINSVLDISKIENNKIELEISEFNINCLIEEVLLLCQHLVKGKDVTLEADLSKISQTNIWGDRQRIKQILINIASNACKFTQQGSIKVIGDLKEEMLYFDIVDTGIGISKEAQSSLFKPFYQENIESTKDHFRRKYGGTGLGLSIVKGLISLMKGEISLHSQKGEGSTFSFCIQVARTASPKSQEIIANESFKRRTDSEIPKILIIDDSEENRAILKLYLKNFNISIDEASNGNDGINLTLTNCYDLIFLDIQMPVIDGIDTCKIIREKENENNPNYIVACSAHAFNEDIDYCLKSGFSDHMAKPVKKEAFHKMIKKYSIPLN